MLPVNRDIYSPEKFHEFVEVLEICRELVLASSAVKNKLALILLDNTAEVLLYHQYCESINDDDYFKHIIRPKYSLRQRKKSAKGMPGKIYFMNCVKKAISKRDATVLRVSHKYRNAAFHRDEHNPKANKIIAPILFQTVCNTYARSFSRGVIQGGDESALKWLHKYGIKEPYLDYKRAARQIALRLTKGVKVSDKLVTATLSEDLMHRWEKLTTEVAKKLPLPELVLDEILKSEEFDEEVDCEEISSVWHEINYGIVEGKRPSREEYFRSKREYLTKIRAAYDAFISTTTWRQALKLKTSIAGLACAKGRDTVMQRYQYLDEFLSKVERFMYAMIDKNDAANEMAAEIARGK